MSKTKTTSTDMFTATIRHYLDQRARDDEQFAAKYAEPSKSIDECVKYIYSEVRKSGRTGFADEEIYGMAVHYYDAAAIVVPKNVATPALVCVPGAYSGDKPTKEKVKKQAPEMPSLF